MIARQDQKSTERHCACEGSAKAQTKNTADRQDAKADQRDLGAIEFRRIRLVLFGKDRTQALG